MKIRFTELPFFFAASLFLVGPGFGPASAQQLGTEFQVNTFTTSYQISHAVAADGSGNFVVVWQSRDQDGSLEGVFGQRYDSAGTPVGSEFRVNTFTTSDQRSPSVAADGSGNFVVVWDSYGQDGEVSGVFGQRYDPAGSKVGSEFQVNSYTTSSQFYPAVAALGSGNFVVAWNSYDQDGSVEGVFGQRFNSAGGKVGSEFRVNTYTTNGQKQPAVAADVSGNFVVVWHSAGQDGSFDGVFGQRFDSAGSTVGSEFRVNTFTWNDQRSSAVAVYNSGSFVVAWSSLEQDASSWGVFGQRFDSAGVKVGSELQINTHTTDFQIFPTVAADGSGNFVMAWQSPDQDGSDLGVFGQRFDSAGSKVGSELQLNSYTTSKQDRPAVATDGSGHFVVAWESLYQDGALEGVFGRRMTLPTIFSDDFETTDTCVWSASVGGGC